MSDYDARLSSAKQEVTRAMALVATGKMDAMDLAGRIDDLNKAWDDVTDVLVRQRDARDKTIFALHARLAESESR